MLLFDFDSFVLNIRTFSLFDLLVSLSLDDIDFDIVYEDTFNTNYDIMVDIVSFDLNLVLDCHPFEIWIVYRFKSACARGRIIFLKIP